MLPVIATGIVDIVDRVMGAILPETPAEKLDQLKVAIQAELVNNQLLQANLTVDAAEGQSADTFVAGWRPFIGWVCGLAFAWTYVAQPMVIFVSTILHHPVMGLPILDTSEMMPVMMGMLGLATARTYEKTQNVHGKH